MRNDTQRNPCGYIKNRLLVVMLVYNQNVRKNADFFPVFNERAQKKKELVTRSSTSSSSILDSHPITLTMESVYILIVLIIP